MFTSKLQLPANMASNSMLLLLLSAVCAAAVGELSLHTSLPQSPCMPSNRTSHCLKSLKSPFGLCSQPLDGHLTVPWILTQIGTALCMQ